MYKVGKGVATHSSRLLLVRQRGSAAAAAAGARRASAMTSCRAATGLPAPNSFSALCSSACA